MLAPPGGKTNFSLGGYGEDPAPATKKQSSEVAEEVKQEGQKQVEKDLYKPSPPQPIRPAGNIVILKRASHPPPCLAETVLLISFFVCS